METSEQRLRELLSEAFAALPPPPSPRRIQARAPRRPPSKRRAVLVIGVAAVVVVVAVAVAVLARGDGDRGLDTIAPGPTASVTTAGPTASVTTARPTGEALTAQQLVSATVTELATPPSNLIYGFQLFAIDHGLLLWGIRDPTSHQVTAARYSMQDDTWTTLDFPTMSSVPDDLSSGISVVSTGTELLLLGRENLALDLSTGKWRPLAEMPRPFPTTAFAFWTGREAVVIGGASSPGATEFVGQAFDPATNRWRPIAVPPQKIKVINSSLSAGAVLWTGTEALVYGIRDDGLTGPGGGSKTEYFIYDPPTDSWRSEASPLGGFMPEAGATDSRTAYWARFGDVVGLALDTGQRIDISPLYGRTDSQLVVVGNQLVNLDGTTLSVFDPATKKWIPGPLVAGRTAVVHGKTIYVVERSNPNLQLSRVATG